MSLVGRLQSMKGAIIGGSLLIASASAGIVWLSMAAVGGIAAMLGLFWARVIVGVVLLAPIAIVLIVARTQSQQQRRDAAITSNSSDDAALAAIAGAARKMIDKSPLAALSLASLAGLISTRHPQALSLLATVLEESDELGRAVPAESSVDSASLRTPTSVADADAGDSLPAYSSVCESREPAK